MMKKIVFDVPLSIHQDFCKLFPEWGERTIFLRKVVRETVKLAKEKDHFIKKIAGTVVGGYENHA